MTHRKIHETASPQDFQVFQRADLAMTLIQHDASGNLKTKGQITYQWDVRDRLVGISGSGVTANFNYDALGRRASKTVNGQTLGYQYDGADIIQDSTSQYLQGVGVDDVLSRTTNGNNEYYLKDHLGSTVALADQSGNLSTQYSYSPYGQVSKTGTSSNYFTYTGREDDSTGLYYYRARYYSPDLKRFSAEDSIGFAGGGSNLYIYVDGNPISGTDPTGHYSIMLPGGYDEPGMMNKNLEANDPGRSQLVKFNGEPNPYAEGGIANKQIDNWISQNNGIGKNETINIVCHSNGCNAVNDVVNHLREKFRNKIRVVILDGQGTRDPEAACEVYRISSNNPYLFRDGSGWGAWISGWQLNSHFVTTPGTMHNDLIYSSQPINAAEKFLKTGERTYKSNNDYR
jgi:RHS repeat-associated protein